MVCNDSSVPIGSGSGNNTCTSILSQIVTYGEIYACPIDGSLAKKGELFLIF